MVSEQDGFIPIARPWLEEEEAQAARVAILSGWVTQGPQVAEFENEFAEYVGAPHACAVSSCTAALHLALLAIGVQTGDEVVTVSHSFIATANAIRYCGAAPVFVDIQPETYNIDPTHIAEAITSRTRCILVPHQMGMPCDLRAIKDIAASHDLPVVEDAACAAGSEICWNGRWEKIGRPHGDVACFSFHPRKIITTGDGGMITTSSAELDQEFRLLRQHGMSVSDKARHGCSQIVFETYDLLGYNYRMTDIQAAVGRQQLRRLPLILQRRRHLAARYKELLRRVPGLQLPKEPTWAHSNWQSYSLRLPSDCKQRAIMQFMLDRGIATRRGIMCAHREAPYADSEVSCSNRLRLGGLDESERAQDQSILLPLYPQMTDVEQSRVVQVLSSALRKIRRQRPGD